jgi:hypothetical protein
MPKKTRTVDTLICELCDAVFPYKQSGKKANRFCSWGCLQASRTPEGRFWAKVNKDGPLPERCPERGPCWLWVGSLFSDSGYGQFWLDGTNRRAHIVSYEWVNGPVPDDTDADQVQHLCNVRTCVNPAHLKLGTPAENTHYAAESGRLASGDRHWTRQPGVALPGLKGTSNGMAKLNDALVIQIRRDAQTGIPYPILAERNQVTVATICLIVKRKTWKHL